MSTKLSFSAILADFLVAIGQGEQGLEDARQNLSEILEYNPATLFNRVNRNNNSKISADEIINFCTDNGLENIEKDETQLLVDFFDDSGDGMLNFEEFSHIVLPCEDMELREAVLSRNSFESVVNRGEYLNDDVEHSVVKVFDKEVTLIRTLVKFVRELCWWNYTEIDWFRLIGPQNKLDKLDVHMLDKFLRSQGHIVSDLDLVAIIRRMDADGDASVNFQEWVDFLKLHGYTYKPPEIKIQIKEIPREFPVYVPVPEVVEKVVEVEKPVYVPKYIPEPVPLPPPREVLPPPRVDYRAYSPVVRRNDYRLSSPARVERQSSPLRDYGYRAEVNYRDYDQRYNYPASRATSFAAYDYRPDFYANSAFRSRYGRATFY